MYRTFFFFIEIIIFLDWSLTQKGAYVVRFFIVTALIVRRLFDNSSLCKVIMPIGIPFYVRVNWLFKVYCADWDEKFLFYTENRFMTQEVRSDFIILQKIYLLWFYCSQFSIQFYSNLSRVFVFLPKSKQCTAYTTLLIELQMEKIEWKDAVAYRNRETRARIGHSLYRLCVQRMTSIAMRNVCCENTYEFVRYWQLRVCSLL